VYDRDDFDGMLYAYCKKNHDLNFRDY